MLPVDYGYKIFLKHWLHMSEWKEKGLKSINICFFCVRVLCVCMWAEKNYFYISFYDYCTCHLLLGYSSSYCCFSVLFQNLYCVCSQGISISIPNKLSLVENQKTEKWNKVAPCSDQVLHIWILRMHNIKILNKHMLKHMCISECRISNLWEEKNEN